MAKPLLEIRVDDMDSVPDVYYNGERIKGKMRVQYAWGTKGDSLRFREHSIHLEFVDSNQKAGKKTIGFDRF